MRYSALPLGLATSAMATNLYVSSYIGTITSLKLEEDGLASYSLKTTFVNNNTTPQPSWLEKVGSVVYCVDENFSGNGSIAAYNTSPSGQLTQFDRHETLAGPVSTIVYNGGKALAAAHYSGSALTSWTVGSNGGLTNLQNFTFKLTKPGTNPARQEAPHPHEVLVDPTDSFIVSPDLGADLVRVFSINKKDSTLTESTPYAVPAGSGPRHGAFLKAANATYFFLISELANTVASYQVSYNGTGLGFTPIQTYGTYGNLTTPAGAAAAELILSPDQKFLSASSRNATIFQIPNFDKANSTKIPSDALQSWKIDPATGKLAFVQNAPAGGFYPRQFSLNKNGTMAAVGMQQNARVVIVKRDPVAGTFGDFLAAVNIPGEITSVIWDE